MEFVNEVLENIWKDRYRKNNESLDDNFKRVARYIAKDENEYRLFYDIMKNVLFLPAGRTMSNSGIGRDLTLNNCFVAPQIADELSDIFDKVKLGACTHQKGGGIGYDFSQLRPAGTPTSNDAIASGALSFMDVFNAQTATILQGNRRGANMGVMNIYNPDIEEFICAKSKEEGRLNHFNVSVMVDNDFMEAAEADKTIFLHHPVYDESGRILKDESKWKIKKEVSAKRLWNLVIEKAYENGEPGVFFYNNLNNDNNLWYIENIVCSNPCAEYLSGTVYGENPISHEKLDKNEYGGACNLGSLFLHNYIRNPFTQSAYIDYDELKRVIKIAIRMLDNIIDINNFPDKIYENYQKSFRTVGLGITGLADALAMLNIKYNSNVAQCFTFDLMNFIAKNAYRASIELAKEKGSFPYLDKDKYVQSGFLQKHVNIPDEEWSEIVEDIKVYGIRNAKLLSVAPTGTLSLTFGNNCSSGLEPIFSLEYERKVKFGGQDEENANIVKMRDFAYGEWLKIKDRPECVVTKDVFITALDMKVNEHLAILSSIAWNTDMSCSKTINVPENYSFGDTKEIYTKCHKAGIKGCTIFRPNPIRKGILYSESTATVNENITSKDIELPRGYIIKADDNCIGMKRTLKTGCGTLHCEAFFDPTNGDLLETYFSKGSSGGCVDADTEYFNGSEWKKISDYKRGSKEKVLQYNENGVAELIEPINYIVNNGVNTLKHFTSDVGLDMVLSEDHRMYVYKNYNKYITGMASKLTHEIITVSDYLNRGGSKERHVPTTFSFKASGIPLENKYIRLLVAIYAHGSFEGNKIIMGLKKERKKDRLRDLLCACDIGWTERDIHNTKYTYFYIHPVPSIINWFTDKKFTSKWYNCTDEQLSVIIDECVYWDGCVGVGNRLGEYYSSKKEEVDFIQFALTRLGYRASISSNSSRESVSPSYRIRWTKQNTHNLKSAKITDFKTTDGNSYCFTVPSGLLVLRRNNKIFITGNCNNFMIGLSRMISLASRAGCDIYSIVDQLKSCGSCPSYAVRSAVNKDTSKGSCCPVAIGNALLNMYEVYRKEINMDEPEENIENSIIIEDKKCPDCGEPLDFEGGCNICRSCGYTKCS